MDDIYIRNRIKFIISEAAYSHRKMSDVTMVMRLISNYYTVGLLDASSGRVKALNRNMSSRAIEFMKSCDSFEEFHKGTINEHEYPLVCTWNWIVEYKPSVDEIIEHFSQHKFVTVTKDEDNMLRSLKLTKSNPENRYTLADIVVNLSTTAPKEYFISRRASAAQ